MAATSNFYSGGINKSELTDRKCQEFTCNPTTNSDIAILSNRLAQFCKHTPISFQLLNSITRYLFIFGL